MRASELQSSCPRRLSRYKLLLPTKTLPPGDAAPRAQNVPGQVVARDVVFLQSPPRVCSIVNSLYSCYRPPPSCVVISVQRLKRGVTAAGAEPRDVQSECRQCPVVAKEQSSGGQERSVGTQANGRRAVLLCGRAASKVNVHLVMVECCWYTRGEEGVRGRVVRHKSGCARVRMCAVSAGVSPK